MLLSLPLLVAIAQDDWLQKFEFHHDICLSIPCGTLTAVRLLLSLSLYLSQGRPTFLLPVSSWLYMRTLGIRSSLILITWPGQPNCDCIRKVSMPPNFALSKKVNVRNFVFQSVTTDCPKTAFMEDIELIYVCPVRGLGLCSIQDSWHEEKLKDS